MILAGPGHGASERMEPGAGGLHPAAHPGVLFGAAEGKKIRIVIVEDHPFVRQSLVNLINRQTDLSCCGEADTVAETPGLISRAQPNLIMMDLRLKDAEAFELIGFLTREFPSVPILVLSQNGETESAERALEAGARGYVMKQDATEEILAAIRAVLHGKLYVSRDMACRLLQKLMEAKG